MPANCALNDWDAHSYYFKDINIPMSDFNRIHNKIIKVKCPVSWYKAGDYKMTCIENAKDLHR